MKIVLLEQAEKDLLHIDKYLAEQSPRAADALVERIDEKLANLRHFPFIGRSRSEFGLGIRSIVVGVYVIFYRVHADRITIMRVIHGRMDIDQEFNR